ncbi:MAG: hypothetical protein NVSMB29_03350 [Candidatus Dormibacteria bacterium]
MLAACAGTAPQPAPDAAVSGRPSPPPATAPSTPAPDCAQATLERLSDPQRVGQLLMLELSRQRAAEALDGIAALHAGNVVLNGPGWNGRGLVAAASGRLQGLATNNGGVGFLIAGNQEGGEPGGLQVFYGEGFSPIPSALAQGLIAPPTLENEAANWGRELAAAGVNLNLAPVLDIVPASARSEAIGAYDREYGHTPGAVIDHATAVVRGLTAAGVGATIKHFPSLGHVAGNTDFTQNGITDLTTTADSPDVAAYTEGIRAGAGFVMISLATYARLDPGEPAVFSPAVITDLLRHRLGFQGVVVSDDLGVAAALAGVPLGERAVRFLTAGGDLLVVEQGRAGAAAVMAAAIQERMAGHPAFRARVLEAALRVLRAKAALHLLPGCG